MNFLTCDTKVFVSIFKFASKNTLFGQKNVSFEHTFVHKIEHIITEVFRPGPKIFGKRQILCIVAYFCHKMAAGRVFNLFSHYYSISPVVTLPHSSPIRPSVSEEDAPQGHLVVSLVVVPEPMVSHVVVSHT